ncbi:MAG: flagellar basal body rod protein FlgC [Gammaproteobacteria bacterium]|nr:flagellar basal body rod protein FlgC [Gammaproteobacteria bacterium]
MDYLSSFDISASGMTVEKLQMDIISLNLANARTTRTARGGTYKPLTLITKTIEPDFSEHINKTMTLQQYPRGVEVDEVVPMNVAEKLSYEPEHPDADKKGFVHYPGVDSTAEMINLIRATRAYEANVRALNAAKLMAQKALEIGS